MQETLCTPLPGIRLSLGFDLANIAHHFGLLSPRLGVQVAEAKSPSPELDSNPRPLTLKSQT